MVEIVGTYEGLEASLTWADGELVGTDWAVKLFGSFVRHHEGIPIPVDVTGMRKVTRHHIGHASSVAYLAKEWFDHGVEITGDLPSPGNVPRGAVA